MRTLYLTIGFLGSGKSTWAKNFVEKHSDTKIVSADGFRTMLNGGYKYLVELDDIIDAFMIKTAAILLANGYDVIIDVGNLTKERRGTWMALSFDKLVAVLMPQKDKQWHLSNRLKKAHWHEQDEEFWDKIAERERKAFEPINENHFDEVIQVKEFEKEN